MTTSVALPEAWQRAMTRATIQHLAAEKINDHLFAVRSTSHRGTKHLVSLDRAGRIAHCSDCPGWEHGGRQHPCKHVGCVAKRLLREQGHTSARAN